MFFSHGKLQMEPSYERFMVSDPPQGRGDDDPATITPLDLN